MSLISATPSCYVLDASAMVAELRQEPGDLVVQGLLSQTSAPCYAHALNLSEVYYEVLRAYDQATAEQSIDKFLAAGVIMRDDMDRVFWQRVGDLKVSPGKLSLADCCALALSLRLGATLVTSDHHEFDRVAQIAIVPVLFIR